jgi:hypothetical protein
MRVLQAVYSSIRYSQYMAGLDGGTVVALRFGADTLLVLDGLAAAEGVSRSGLIRLLVREALELRAASGADVLVPGGSSVIRGEPAALEEPRPLVPLSSAPLGVPDRLPAPEALDAFRAEKIRALRASISEAEGGVAKLVKPAVRSAARVLQEPPPGYEMVNGRPVWAGEVDADGWPMGSEPA